MPKWLEIPKDPRLADVAIIGVNGVQAVCIVFGRAQTAHALGCLNP